MKNHSIQNHGHRGARGRMPENTLPAVDCAIRAGADAVEVDLNYCGDGTVVVFHDLAITPVVARHHIRGRDFDPLPLINADMASIRQFDVGCLQPGSDYARRFPDQACLSSISIPTLGELLDYLSRQAPADFIINLELKSHAGIDDENLVHYLDTVIRAINLHDILHRTYLQSFDWRIVRLAGERCPGLLTGLLTDQQTDGQPRIPCEGERTFWTDNLDLADYDGSVPRMIHSTGAQVWSANHQDLQGESIQEAHSLGLAVYTWTVNDRRDMERMIRLGVDAITTDYPDTLSMLLGR